MPVNGKIPPTTSVDELALCIFIVDFTELRAPAATVAAVATASASA